MKLYEGMRLGDLEDLVLPLVTADEYESKVDDNAVVFGFYVSDHDAANDLNRFIQKSPVSLLDTDVSPAPDQHGYYLVFFELLNNDKLAENLSDILEEVSPLVAVDKWKMRIRGVDRLVPFSQQAVKSHFDITPTEKNDPVAESVMEFLHNTAIERVVARDGHLVMEGFGYRDEFDIIAFGSLDKILQEDEIEVKKSDVGFEAAASNQRLIRHLGEGWTVSSANGMNLLANENSDKVLLVKNTR